MRPFNVLVAAACLALPAPLIAHALTVETAVAAAASVDEDRDDEGGNDRLGLLGLLGLGGLLGFFRREPDIHVDARRDEQA